MHSCRPAVLTLALILLPGIGHAQTDPGMFRNWNDTAKPRRPEAACPDLRALTNYDLSIDTATLVPPEGDMPAFCLVQGLILPEVRFEVGLPQEWNGRLYMFGNGGFAGETLASGGRVAIRNAAIRCFVAEGYRRPVRSIGAIPNSAYLLHARVLG